MNVSIFQNISVVENPENILLLEYLDRTRDGDWQDIVSQCRLIKDKAKRDEFKRRMPTTTLSGVFSYRNEGGLKAHSGYINIDLDDVENLDMVKSALMKDRYVFSVFMSTSGNGLRVLFKINPSKHRESFLGISKYIYDNYSEIADPNGISVSKPYVVSFDPYLYLNRNCLEFKLYVKEKEYKPVKDFVFVPSDLDEIVKRIVSRGVNIAESYEDWLKVGFALSESLGEDGRFYFHELSKFSSKYRPITTDKQYTACLKAKGTTKINISSLYYLAKLQNVEIVSQQTRTIIRFTKNGKRAGLSKKQISENLKKYESIDNADSVIDKVFDNPGFDDSGDDSIIPQLEMFIESNYTLQMNDVTGYVEEAGVPLSPSDLNSIYISAKKLIPKLDYQLFMRLLKSDFIQKYNPFYKFLGSNGEPYILPAIQEDQDKEYDSPLIDKLAKSIENDEPAFTRFFLRKWIVSIISSMHKVHSPLLLALLGEQNTGKTEFFRRLLPPELCQYYAESKLDQGKDDELLMTENILIMDDELSGKSKQESKKLNHITSKQWYSIRRPYGDHNEKILRIAVLCGTSNYLEILSDPTGNRRVIPIVVKNIDKKLYNSINKKDLFLEAYRLYREGFDWRISSKDDIQYLNKNQKEHEMTVKERELLITFFAVPKEGDTEDVYNMSTTDMMVELERLSNMRLSAAALGAEISKAKFVRKTVRVGTSTPKLWKVKKINRTGNPQYFGDNNPF